MCRVSTYPIFRAVDFLIGVLIEFVVGFESMAANVSSGGGYGAVFKFFSGLNLW